MQKQPSAVIATSFEVHTRSHVRFSHAFCLIDFILYSCRFEAACAEHRAFCCVPDRLAAPLRRARTVRAEISRSSNTPFCGLRRDAICQDVVTRISTSTRPLMARMHALMQGCTREKAFASPCVRSQVRADGAAHACSNASTRQACTRVVVLRYSCVWTFVDSCARARLRASQCDLAFCSRASSCIARAI
eukprot:3406006-Pleurochrysis_carterae.AAC.1